MTRRWITIRSASSGVFGIGYFALDIWRLVFHSSVLLSFSLSFIRGHPWFHSYARAGKAAAGLHGHIAAQAKRTFGRVVALDPEFHKGFGAYRQLDFSPAAIDQRARGDHARAHFLQHANGFARRAAGGPHIFH